jgi:hypothetical protein
MSAFDRGSSACIIPFNGTSAAATTVYHRPPIIRGTVTAAARGRHYRLADVRSTPFSRRHPQFSSLFAEALQQADCLCVPGELGGLRKDPALRATTPDYDRIAATGRSSMGWIG